MEILYITAKTNCLHGNACILCVFHVNTICLHGNTSLHGNTCEHRARKTGLNDTLDDVRKTAIYKRHEIRLTFVAVCKHGGELHLDLHEMFEQNIYITKRHVSSQKTEM